MLLPFVLAALITFTQDPVPSEAPPAAPEVAFGGLDPVRLCEGEELPGNGALQTTYDRFSYHFVDEASRTRFLSAPERWGLQWGGACGRMGPLSGKGDPLRWTVYDGRSYVFASDDCLATFLSAPERFCAPVPELPPFDEATMKRGDEWIMRAVAAHGGAAFLDGKRALQLVHEREHDGWRERTETWIGDDLSLRASSTWNTDKGDTSSTNWWLNGDEAWVDDGDGFVRKLLSPAQFDDLRRIVLREPTALLWARKRADFQAIDFGPSRFGKRTVNDVAVITAGLTTTLHLHQETGEILGLSWIGRLNDGVQREVSEELTAWQLVEGRSVASGRLIVIDYFEGRPNPMEYQSVRLHAEAPKGTFRPAQ